MKTSDLLDALCGSVTEGEREALAADPSDSSGLVIGRANRETILRMLDWEVACDDDVPDERVERLAGLTRDYLERYMADQPEGHKWVVLATLFNAFVARAPIHPEDIVGAHLVRRGSAFAYACPARDDAQDSICRFCVCEACEVDC